MTRCRQPGARTEPCPRCQTPRTTVRIASGDCGCALIICRCDYGEPVLHLVEDPDCRGCPLSVVAWRSHVIRKRRGLRAD